ncbi:hypothetical protein PMAYCL1PPCAC_03251, partial [Pristionchus mayeri]
IQTCSSNIVVELCRAHEVRHLFIRQIGFKATNFESFASQLAHLDVTLDIYENSHSAHLVYFNKAPVFWNKIIEGLREENVSLRMITRHDDNFDRNHYNYQMRAHIRCEKADSPNAQQPMFPVDHTRGFNLSSCRAYFDAPRPFLDELANELKEKHNVLMRLTTKEDPSFPNGGYGEYVSAHLRCEKGDAPSGHPLVAVETKRGFSI